MFKFSARNIIGLGLICGSLILGVWIYFPLKVREKITTIPSFGQSRLTWSPMMRFGEVNDVRIEFSSTGVQDAINSILNDLDGDYVQPQELIIGKTHHLIIEARIEIPGVKILPNEEIVQSFVQPENIMFLWQVAPVIPENISGEVWLYIHLKPIESGWDTRRPILIQGFTIKTIDLLGMTTRTAKILTVMVMGIGFIIWFDMIGKIIFYIREKKDKNIQKR